VEAGGAVNGAPTAGGPYRGLAPFGDADFDALLFFGRDREREVIAANLAAARLTVLYGPTGTGKSSVLRAGVAHGLRREARERAGDDHPNVAVAVVDGWQDDPVLAIRTAVAAELEGIADESTRAAAAGAGSLADALAAWTDALDGELYLVLDQLEEYFLYHEREDGSDSLAKELPEVVTQPGLRVGVLLSVREDSLARLDRFKRQLPALFGNVLRLDRLDRAAGRAAIVGPLERYAALAANGGPSRAEPELVEAVLDQVATADPRPGCAVEAPFLQLVMERLWHAESEAGSELLRVETLRQLGGAERIVRGHLEDAVADLDPSGRDVAAAAFNHLVTPSGTKIAHASDDLAEYAGVAADDLTPVVAALTDARILRQVAAADGSGETRYEIFHDVLAEPVRTWRRAHAEERRLQAERAAAGKRHRRLLYLAGASLLALAIAVGLAVFALTQRSQARSQAALAQSRELAASAVAQLPGDPELGLLLAREAARVEPTPQAENALREALLSSRVQAVLVGHQGAVRQVAFGPDGAVVATAGGDSTARLFDARTGEMLQVLGLGGPVTSVAFSADGEQLLTASEDGTARTWSAETGARLVTYQHDGPVQGASFGPDDRVLTWGRDGTARVWNGTTQALVLRHGGPVLDATFSPDGSRILTASEDLTARLFDARTGELLHVLEHEKPVTGGSFSPDGVLIVTSGRERISRIWETATGRLVHELSEHDLAVRSASFSPDGAYVVTTSKDGAARVWDVATGVRHAIFLDHRNALTGAAFSPDGEHVVTTSSDRSARIWETATARAGPVLLGHGDTVTDATFSPDGALVVTASLDGTARVWDASTELSLEQLALPGAVTAMAISPDGGNVLAVTAGAAQLLRADTGELVRSLEHTGVNDAAFGPNGEVATAGEDGIVQLRNAATGELVRSFEQDAPVTAVAVSEDGTLLVSGAADGTARIWDVNTGALQRQFEASRTRVTGVAINPDGSLVSTASAAGTTRIWDVDDGRLLHAFGGHGGAVTSVSFSADGSRLLTGSRDHDGRIWNVATGRPLHVLQGHFGPVSDAAFSPDGRWVVTAGPVTAGLWDAETGQLVSYLRGHTDLVTAAAFTPDGGRIVTAGLDGSVRSYVCDLCGSIEALEALADDRLEQLGRTLTPAERAEFIEG
jgi:WD40 repeat protein